MHAFIIIIIIIVLDIIDYVTLTDRYLPRIHGAWPRAHVVRYGAITSSRTAYQDRSKQFLYPSEVPPLLKLPNHSST